jgi:nanoRNase/pAp phosphatase (c-di-AMP/oligoRNAs hydrolase)
METTPLQQAADLLKKSQSILLCLPQTLSTDAVASGIALHLALTQQGKQAKLVSATTELPASHAFLPKTPGITADLDTLKKFVISVDTRRAPVSELSYDTTDGALNIFLTPKTGAYAPGDVTTRTSQPTFDCAVTFDCQDLDHLGSVFEQNAELFYATPIINIDHSAANEHFGQVNVVDLVATSVAEIVTDLLRIIDPKVVSNDIATALLTGMIAKTKSFQTPTVTPKSLTTASQLVVAGAKREDIVRSLFQTKSLSVLKLWGRALARLRATDDSKLVWAVLNRADFDRAGATPDSLPGVLDELMVNTPRALVMAVVYEDPLGGTHVLVQTHRSVNGLKLYAAYDPEGTAHMFSWHLTDGSIADAELQLRLGVEQLPAST